MIDNTAYISPEECKQLQLSIATENPARLVNNLLPWQSMAKMAGIMIINTHLFLPGRPISTW